LSTNETPAAPEDGSSADKRAVGDLGSYLRLLGDETRFRIFSLLTKGELCVCEIEDATGLSQSLVSNHLAALRRAGLVESRRDDEDGRWIFYRANREVAAALCGSLTKLLDVRLSPSDRRRAEQVCRLRQPKET